MTVFRVKASSRIIYTLTFLAIGIGGTLFGFYLGQTAGNDFYIFLLLLIGLTAVVFIPDLLSTFTMEWTFEDYGMRIQSSPPHIFIKRRDVTIKWTEIKDYKYKPDRYFNVFKIWFDDSVIKVCHSNYRIVSDDDFESFLSYFEKRVNEYNESGLNILYPIKRRKTVYETKLGMALAIFLLLCMIGIPILYNAFPNRKIDLITLTVGYSGSIYFISQVMSYRKKNKIKTRS